VLDSFTTFSTVEKLSFRAIAQSDWSQSSWVNSEGRGSYVRVAVHAGGTRCILGITQRWRWRTLPISSFTFALSPVRLGNQRHQILCHSRRQLSEKQASRIDIEACVASDPSQLHCLYEGRASLQFYRAGHRRSLILASNTSPSARGG
jgi:hypothetical protein